MKYYQRRKKITVDNLSIVLLLLLIALIYMKYDISTELLVEIICLGFAILISATMLIRYIVKKHRMNKYAKSSLNEIDHMSGEEFEEYLQAVFYKMGYHASLTPKSGDYGADLIFMSNKDRVVVQAKRYQGNVGIAAVQQIIGAKEYYHANKALVITNSYFTYAAQNLASESGVILWDREQLINFTDQDFESGKVVL